MIDDGVGQLVEVIEFFLPNVGELESRKFFQNPGLEEA
jgi:hypothetical protein